jgi:hypothetical protein
MGRATQPADGYRVDPDAVSLHTTPDDYNYNDAPEISDAPPSYADSADHRNPTIVSRFVEPRIRHVPPPTTRTDHNNPSFKNGKPIVCETATLMDPKLDSDPAALEDAVCTAGNEMPMPYIYIMGTHKETVKRGDKKETHHITDFRIVINMQRYINNCHGSSYIPSVPITTVENGVKTHRGTISKCRAPGIKQDIEIGTPKPTLQEWCHRYCASPRMLRIFRLERPVPGLDQQYLKNRIEGLIASANYRGNVSVTFPIEDRYLDIYTSNKINQWRLKTWVCWIFYLTFLWIFTWPYLFFMTKRYAVVMAEWPFSVIEEDGTKKYTTISEEQWFENWKVGVRRLVLDRFQGDATEEMLTGVMARSEDPPMPGTVNTGHAGIDNAVGILTQGFQVARAIQSGGNVGRGLQGGWGYDT